MHSNQHIKQADLITLFRAITVFYLTDNILRNIPHIQSECEKIFRRILSVPQNTVMALNNVILLELALIIIFYTVG